jgi:hypothetical protein
VGIIDILEISKLVNVLGVAAKISCVGMLLWPKLRNPAGDLSTSHVLQLASFNALVAITIVMSNARLNTDNRNI